MSTTLFIPMPEWQAMLFLRDRLTGFDRMLHPEKHTTLSQEVVPTKNGLYGFRLRPDAVEHGFSVYPQGFAMVRIVLPGLLQGNLRMRRHFMSTSIPDSGTPLYLLDHDGLQELRESCAADALDLFVDQIFAGGVRRSQAQPCADGSCVQHPGDADTTIKLD